jgi:GAF domain-containing protein/HAMP domain-containing protein
MSLKSKIIALTLAFVATAVILGAGAFYLFNALGRNLEAMNVQMQTHKMHADLRGAILDFIHAANGWAITGDESYKKQYKSSLSNVNKFFGELSARPEDEQVIESIGTDFQEAKKFARIIINTRRPVGNVRALRALNLLEKQEEMLYAKIDKLSGQSLDSTVDILSEGEKIKATLTYYLVLLIALSIMVSGLLVLLLRRLLENPYQEMLKATERVEEGDLSYRIDSERADEFGIIARRFDSMVESLAGSDVLSRKKLRETELLLDVARIAGQTPDLTEALNLMVEAIAEKMRKDVCAVYLLNTEMKAFLLESTSMKEMPVDMSLPVDSEIPARILKDLKPLIVEDTADFPSGSLICEKCGSLIAVPIQRDNSCIGILLLGRDKPRGFLEHEMNTAVIIAHTIATTVKNVELYEAAKNQLKQLSIVYELSKALTSVYDPEELLKTISTDIAKLINARGCVIRLLEEGMLKVKSYYGPMEDTIEALPPGKGIPGWVAKEGKSLFIEDISRMPEEIKGQTVLVGKSAIGIPLKVGERIIGTLGLYDKLDAQGREIPFTHDDFSVAKGFASISAVAIDKARLQEHALAREAEALEAKKRLDLLFESVQGGIITLDRQYKITAANNYIQKWENKPLDEIINNSALDVFHEKGGICPIPSRTNRGR